MTEDIVDGGLQVGLETKIGPGRNLREAREASDITQEAMAKQLHIDIALVRALEEDDFGKFAAPIYVTGHLRAYARLLGLTPEPLIEAYQNLGAAVVPPLERIARLNRRQETESSAQVPRWLVSALVVSVVVTVVLIWRSELSKLLAPIMESPMKSDVGSPDVSKGNGIVTLPPQGTGGTQQPPLSLLNQKGEMGDRGSQAVSATTAEESAKTQPEAPKATLALKAEKPSWVEVKDRSGNRLFYDLMVPGDMHSLEGVPPFDVLLGYAPGVTLEFNGKQVDFSAYSHQDIARFRVDDSGANKN